MTHRRMKTYLITLTLSVLWMLSLIPALEAVLLPIAWALTLLALIKIRPRLTTPPARLVQVEVRRRKQGATDEGAA